MKYNFEITPDFARDFNRLTRTRKNLPDDFDQFLQAFNHTQGDTIPGTSGAKKIRMAATGKGKRGSYRIIYYFLYENTVYFLKIYSKAVQETTSKSEKRRLQQLVLEIKKGNL